MIVADTSNVKYALALGRDSGRSIIHRRTDRDFEGIMVVQSRRAQSQNAVSVADESLFARCI